MGLMSFFQRQHDESSAQAQAPDAVTHARTRARRRLIGATVLLGIGVIGFPLLFETQPRPVPVDIPIEIPKRESAPPLPLPPVQPASPAPAAAVPPPAVAEAPPTPPTAAPVITERAAEQGREVTPAKPAASTPALSPRPAASMPRPAASTPRPVAAASAGGAGTPARPPAATDDGQRARALLEGKSGGSPPAVAKPAETAASAPRVIVQVGAYTDADKLREARQKVEKLGFKTYTQVIEAEGAKRTRVRVGPFATREEADKAAARLKAAGLPAAILSL